MRISEHTDMVLSELAPYLDEAIAIMFEEIDNTSYSFAEATARKKKGMSALTKGLIGIGAAAGLAQLHPGVRKAEAAAAKSAKIFTKGAYRKGRRFVKETSRKAGGWLGEQTGKVARKVKDVFKNKKGYKGYNYNPTTVSGG